LTEQELKPQLKTDSQYEEPILKKVGHSGLSEYDPFECFISELKYVRGRWDYE
jgi:hypothetical protein